MGPAGRRGVYRVCVFRHWFLSRRKLFDGPPVGQVDISHGLVGFLVLLRVGQVLPQEHLVAPWIEERGVGSAELRPEVVAPQLGASEPVCRLKDPVE